MNATISVWADYIRALPWVDIRDALNLGLYYLAVLAAIGALLRLKTIAQVLRDFLHARGPLWALQQTVDKLKELEPSILNLRDQVALMDDRLEAAAKQVTELQAETISSRSDAEEVDTEIGASPVLEPVPKPDDQDHNWNHLREYWQRNRKRIEYIIDQIGDGRTRLAYDRLPRTSYSRIIHKLQGQRLITAAAATASKELIDTFNLYRPRNKSIPDEAIGALAVLDAQLEKELVPFAQVVAAEEADEPTPPTRPRPVTNGRSVSANWPTDDPQMPVH